MSQSKAYPVKSNAARAAAKHGLHRSDLVQVGNGWAFELPAGVTEAPLRSRAEASENLRKAKAAAKAEKTASKPAKAAKTAKAKPTKAKAAKAASKPAKAKGTGTKRKAGAKSGKVAAVIAELKARWTPADSILKSTGWVSNTFRGILGAHKKATGENFERKRVDGVTHYRIAA